jgi:outer membrane protein assembly factor BamB
MRYVVPIIGCFLLVTNHAFGEGPGPDAATFWPRWRGPTATGVAPHGNPPTAWSESKNVRWKVGIPGLGHASPIVWGDLVFVQTAVKTDRKGVPATQPPSPSRPSSAGRGRPGRDWIGTSPPTNIYQFILLAVDRRTGKTVWQRVLCEEVPHERLHRDASQASNSPVTDGKHVFAYFGSRGLYCLDMKGEMIWSKRLGRMQTRNGFGEGSSPALSGDTLVVNWDHEGQSFIIAFDKHTGRQLWKVDRDEQTSWATPIVVRAGDNSQVITSASNRIRSYDLLTGELIWQCRGLTTNVIPSPVSADGLVYAVSGYRGNALLAIRYPEAKGDISQSPAVAWKYDGPGTPYAPSPLLYGDLLYLLDNNRSVLSCFDAKTGTKHYVRKRLEDLADGYPSPVGAAGRVYVLDKSGTMAVIQKGPEFKLLAVNKVDDRFTASPAIAGDEMYLRGNKYLYCLAEK